MKTAIYPGSFDPVTNGHLDIIRRAAGLFDKVYVGILINRNKKPLFELQERMDLLREVTKDIPEVEVISFEGLLAEYCKMKGINAVIRGVRGAADFEYELPMSQINQKLNPDTQTVFLATTPEYSYISSSAVKELASFGGDYRDMIPEAVFQAMQNKNRE